MTLEEAMVEIGRLRNAIQRALDDEESGTGWGPDVTVCAYLREALLTPTCKLSRKQQRQMTTDKAKDLSPLLFVGLERRVGRHFSRKG